MSLGLGSDLGKRKNRWEEEGGAGVMSTGPGCESLTRPSLSQAYFLFFLD